ncbi:MAG: hypothetical protein Q7Q71_03965 [Verrucomicrobiota bacterium JB023]|nr:hypothetical protein [Verrucomicrobiota bacterium JB023]
MKWKRPVLVGLVLLGLSLTARVALGMVYSATWLESILEENLACEAQVERVSISLLAGDVRARGVELRALGEDDWTRVAAGELELGVGLLPLIRRELEVKRLVLFQPKVAMRIDAEGSNSLVPLFDQPGSTEEESEKGSGEGAPSGALDAREDSWLARLRETRFIDGEVSILLEKEDLVVFVDQFQVEIEELRFDPHHLETLNTVRMQASARAALYDEEEVKLVGLSLQGPISGQLFNSQSGEFAPDVQAEFAIGGDSFVNPGIKVVRRVWEKARELDRVGLSIGPLPERIGFGRGQRLEGTYQQGVIHLDKPLGLAMGSWQLGLGADSWIATHDGEHELIAEFLIGDQISQTLGSWVGELPEEVRDLAGDRFFEDDQLVLRAQSTGNLSNPEIDFLSQLPEAKPLADELEEKAKGFLKGLLDD